MIAAHGALAAALGLAGCRARPALAIPPESVQVARAETIDVEHTALELELDPRRETLAGTARVRFVSRADALREVAFDLTDLGVHAVRDENGRALSFRHARGVLTIRLGRALARGELAEVAIDYGGRPRRGLYFTDVERGVATQVFTQGECEDARGWFPCLDFPAERATSELAVVMPRAWTSLAAGERVERRELPGGRALERWRMTTPHPAYLMTLVAGDFAVKEARWDGIPLVMLADPTLEPWIEGRFRETGRILEFLSRVFGVRYPYPKYGQAVVANFPFGGMENISATTLTDTWLVDGLGEQDEPAAGLIVHEAAHQWFGDLATCADWSHVWLHEGFATYAEALYAEEVGGARALDEAILAQRESFFAQSAALPPRPIVHGVCREPMDLFVTGHVYPGASIRLHQLRFELGDGAFFAGVRATLAEFRGRAFDTRDFERAMETASGRDLADFFAQWFTGVGSPELVTRWRFEGASGDGEETGGEIVLEVEQTQPPQGGVPEAFRMECEVELALPGEEPRVERVTLARRHEEFRWRAAERPRWVVLDPRGFLPARRSDERSAGEWLALAERSSSAVVRRDAVRALAGVAAEAGGERARLAFVQALQTRLSEDESTPVRVAAAFALAPLAQEFGREALLDAAAHDASSKVRVAALQSLSADARDASLAEFAREQFEGRFSWAVMAAATRLELVARPEVERWRERAATPSPHGILEAYLLPLAAELFDRETARGELVSRLAREHPPLVREAAARALAGLAKEDGRARQALERSVADPEYRVSLAALQSLAAAEDPRCVAAVRRAYPSLVEPRLRRAAERILLAPWASRP